MRLLITLLGLALLSPAAAEVVYPPDPPRDLLPEAVEPAIELLAADAIDALFAGDRPDFLDSFALYPSFSALSAAYGEAFAFSDDPSGFRQLRGELARQRQLAAGFYALARQAMMASSVGVDDVAVVEVLYEPTLWYGLPAVSEVAIDVQLTHAIRTRFRFGMAVRFPEGWSFVQAPRPVVLVIKPALRGNDLDLVDLRALDARLPS